MCNLSTGIEETSVAAVEAVIKKKEPAMA